MFAAAALDSGRDVSQGQGHRPLCPHRLSWGTFLRGLCALRPRLCPGTHSVAASSRAHVSDVTWGRGSEELAEHTRLPSETAACVLGQGAGASAARCGAAPQSDGAEVRCSAQLVPRLPARRPAGSGTLRPLSRAVAGLEDGTAAQGSPAVAPHGGARPVGHCRAAHSPSGLRPHLEPRCRSRVCFGPSPGHPGCTPGDALLRGAVGHVDDPLPENGDISQAAGAAGLCHSDSCSAGDQTHWTLSPFSTESESKPDPKAIAEKPEEKPRSHFKHDQQTVVSWLLGGRSLKPSAQPVPSGRPSAPAGAGVLARAGEDGTRHRVPPAPTVRASGEPLLACRQEQYAWSRCERSETLTWALQASVS